MVKIYDISNMIKIITCFWAVEYHIDVRQTRFEGSAFLDQGDLKKDIFLQKLDIDFYPLLYIRMTFIVIQENKQQNVQKSLSCHKLDSMNSDNLTMDIELFVSRLQSPPVLSLTACQIHVSHYSRPTYTQLLSVSSCSEECC